VPQQSNLEQDDGRYFFDVPIFGLSSPAAKLFEPWHA